MNPANDTSPRPDLDEDTDALVNVEAALKHSRVLAALVVDTEEAQPGTGFGGEWAEMRAALAELRSELQLAIGNLKKERGESDAAEVR